MNEETIYLAGGCFWCTEAVFKQLKGVSSALPGYIGGSVKNPTYREICSGLTGHAEAVEVVFDAEAISLEDLLRVFWTTHDPTTLNRQGADKGTQYRSAVFCTHATQAETARSVMDTFAQPLWKDPIVTEIVMAPAFYPAEAYHVDYYERNPDQGYCQIVIQPKMSKFRKQHAELIKS